MVKSKKLLSLFLAVVMVLSVFTVMASAYTVGPEVAGNINYKYTVEKVNTVPETSDSPEYTANNIYAVTAWLQCDAPVYTAIIPVHFNTEKFSPIMLFDGDVTYPAGAGFGVDDYYENMGEGTVYAYKLGDYMNNTGMYKANGTTATTKALAKCIGLGNANTNVVKGGLSAQLVSPGNPLYDKWNAGLPANTGIMYAQMDIASVEKTAYYNTIDGITTETGWVRMITFYFETLAGVTDADVVGEEFGVYTDNCFTVDGDVDASGYGYFAGATTAKYGTNPEKNVVSNAVVEESAPAYSETTPTIISNLKTQMRFNPENSANLDVRNLAVIDGDALNVYLNDADLLANYTATATQTQQEQLAADLIKDIGFIYSASTETTIDRDDAILWHQGLESTQTYAKKTVSFIDTSTSAGNYVISCMVDNINADDCQTYHLVSLGYLVLDTDFDGTADTYYYYGTVNSTNLADLYGNRPA